MRYNPGDIGNAASGADFRVLVRLWKGCKNLFRLEQLQFWRGFEKSVMRIDNLIRELGVKRCLEKNPEVARVLEQHPLSGLERGVALKRTKGQPAN